MTFERAMLEEVYARLSGDAPLTALVGNRIYPGFPPEDAALPYVVVQLQAAAPDTKTNGAVRILARPLVVVKVVSIGDSPLSALDIYAEIDRIMEEDVEGARGDKFVLGASRETPVVYSEVVDSTRYNHVGGAYRILTSPR